MIGQVLTNFHLNFLELEFSFQYTNIDIPNDIKWGGWWGFGTARIAEISVFLLKSLFYYV